MGPSATSAASPTAPLKARSGYAVRESGLVVPEAYASEEPALAPARPRRWRHAVRCAAAVFAFALVLMFASVEMGSLLGAVVKIGEAVGALLAYRELVTIFGVGPAEPDVSTSG